MRQYYVIFQHPLSFAMLFVLHNTSGEKQDTLPLVPLYRTGNWGSESYSDLLSSSQVVVAGQAENVGLQPLLQHTTPSFYYMWEFKEGQDMSAHKEAEI